MKAIFKPEFEIDVSEWYLGEGLTKKQRIKKIKEDLEDFSVFMLHAEYTNFIKVSVDLKD